MSDYEVVETAKRLGLWLFHLEWPATGELIWTWQREDFEVVNTDHAAYATQRQGLDAMHRILSARA